MAKRWAAMIRAVFALLVISSGMLITSQPTMAQSSTRTIVEFSSLEAIRRSEGDDEIYIFAGTYSPFQGHQVRPDPDANCHDHVDYWRFNDEIRVQYPHVNLLETQDYAVAHISLYDQDDGIFFLGGSDDNLGILGIVARENRVTFFPFSGTWIEGVPYGESMIVQPGEARDVVVNYDTNDAHYRAVFKVIRIEPIHLPPNSVVIDQPQLGANPVCQ